MRKKDYFHTVWVEFVSVYKQRLPGLNAPTKITAIKRYNDMVLPARFRKAFLN